MLYTSSTTRRNNQALTATWHRDINKLLHTKKKTQYACVTAPTNIHTQTQFFVYWLSQCQAKINWSDVSFSPSVSFTVILFETATIFSESSVWETMTIWLVQIQWRAIVSVDVNQWRRIVQLNWKCFVSTWSKFPSDYRRNICKPHAKTCNYKLKIEVYFHK